VAKIPLSSEDSIVHSEPMLAQTPVEVLRRPSLTFTEVRILNILIF
jgi:hypothetical protein